MENSKIIKIEETAFQQANNLIQIIFPSCLEYIGGNALAHTGITSINIGPHVTVFSGYSVNQSPNLNSLTVDENNEKYSSENNFIFNKNTD